MTNIIDNMLSLCPVSEDTIQELKKCMILCRFPKKYQLIKENTFCKSAYFIEKGMTRSFWLVNGEEIYNPQIQISAESETKRSIFREKDKTKRSKKESAQHSKSRNKSFVMTSVSAL